MNTGSIRPPVRTSIFATLSPPAVHPRSQTGALPAPPLLERLHPLPTLRSNRRRSLWRTRFHPAAHLHRHAYATRMRFVKLRTISQFAPTWDIRGTYNIFSYSNVLFLSFLSRLYGPGLRFCSSKFTVRYCKCNK